MPLLDMSRILPNVWTPRPGEQFANQFNIPPWARRVVTLPDVQDLMPSVEQATGRTFNRRGILGGNEGPPSGAGFSEPTDPSQIGGAPRPDMGIIEGLARFGPAAVNPALAATVGLGAIGMGKNPNSLGILGNAMPDPAPSGGGFGPSAADEQAAMDAEEHSFEQDAMAEAAAQAADDEGGGEGDKIICAELHRQGRLPTAIFRADEAYGESVSRETLDGYHLWARPVVRAMKRSSKVSAAMAILAFPVALELAFRMGVGQGSRIGRALLRIGEPACRLLARSRWPRGVQQPGS